MNSILFQYRQKSGDWKSIATEPVLSRRSPAHLIGEEIWWAGQEVDGLTVKISVADTAGHRTTKTFSMLPADPNVSQADLASEIIAPPLPSPFAKSKRQTKSVVVKKSNSETKITGADWQPTLGNSWSSGEPIARPQQSPQQAEIVGMSNEVNSAAPILTISSPTLADAIEEKLRTPHSSQNQETGFVAEYQGSPLHLMRMRSFSWEYSFDVPEDLQGPFRVELWSTRDGGHSWERIAVDEDTSSPIDVTFQEEGLFGCRLEIVKDVSGSPIPPRAGESPSTWIGIDTTPPQVKNLDVVMADENNTDAFTIRYTIDDPLAVPNSVRLSYSPHKTGPWATIATDQASDGTFTWKPHRSLPSRVFVRIEMPDAAGNIGERITPEPITLRTARFIGRLGSPQISPADTP